MFLDGLVIVIVMYNTDKCGWDGGDCIPPDYLHCKGIDNPELIGNGAYFNDPRYNIDEC